MEGGVHYTDMLFLLPECQLFKPAMDHIGAFGDGKQKLFHSLTDFTKTIVRITLRLTHAIFIHRVRKLFFICAHHNKIYRETLRLADRFPSTKMST